MPLKTENSLEIRLQEVLKNNLYFCLNVNISTGIQPRIQDKICFTYCDPGVGHLNVT